MNWTTELPPDCELSPEIAQAQSLTATLSPLGEFAVNIGFLGEVNNVFARLVRLTLDDTDVVIASSTCKPNSRWREILENCGTQPLGKLLFSGEIPCTRSDIMYCLHEEYLLMRCSNFDWEGERLHLVECFLPAMAHFQG